MTSATRPLTRRRPVNEMRQDPATVERGTRITNDAEDFVYLVTGDVEDHNP